MDTNASPKLCFVCGDKGIGFNFDVLTCESCKCFFRRNAWRKDLECKIGTNKCTINVNTRKNCPKCRLNKCFANYMKREMIMSVEARNQRQSIIAFNRRKRIKRHINSQYNKDCIKSETKSTQRHEVMSTTDTISSTDTNVHIMSNDSDYCGYDFTELSLIPTGDVNEMLYEKAFILGMNVMSIARPITDRNIFNELEGNRFRELLIAMNITDNQLLGNINTLPVETYNDFVKIADIQREIDIKYLARVCRSLSCFKEIDEHDKFILLKCGALEVHALRCITYFNYDHQSWTTPLDDNNAMILSIEFVREVEPNIETHNIFLNYTNKMFVEIGSDDQILNMMTAIVLFNPYRPGLKYKAIVKLQQHIYMHLLKRYLMMKYGTESEANEKFMRLLNTLIDLYYLDMKCKQSLLQRPYHPLPPLLREIIQT